MKYLRPHAQGFLERTGTDRLDHELLNVDVVVRVFATVEDIHHRYRHAEDARTAVQRRKMLVQCNIQGRRRRFGRGQGHRQNRIGPQGAFALSTVQGNHCTVNFTLVQCIQPHDVLAYRAIDVSDRALNPFAMVTNSAVTQLQSFAAASGGTGRHTGRSHSTTP
ncbi:hypothetical protein D3C72_1448030 [compost metagenome]